MLALLFATSVLLAEPAPADGWTPLFNGRDLSGWYTFLQEHGKDRDPDRIITIEDGAIHLYKHATEGSRVVMGYITTQKDHGNYHLRLEYRWGTKKFEPRLALKRDAGVYYHILGPDAVWPRALQFQVEQTNVGDLIALHGLQLDSWIDPKTASAPMPTFLDPDQGGHARVLGGKGIAYQKHRAGEFERDGWNRVEIIARGETTTHILNGHVVNRGEKIRLVEGDSTRPVTKGRIALEIEAAEIFFRNVEIRNLDESAVSYRGEIERFRQEREASLRADDGWLTVAGLAWLRPGEARIGSEPACDVVLPSHAPAVVGVLRLGDDGKAEFRAEPGVAVTCSGKRFESGEIHSDSGGRPDVLSIGDVRLILLKRGARHALRIKDNRSRLRSSFAGLRWFPVDESWRIEARFVPHPSSTRIVFDTIVGEPQALESPGYVTFMRDGQEYKLQAALEDDHLWFVFRDATSGRTTHPGARQLSAEMPKGADSVVILDFNKAINLPCAYTPYATCPLAPPQNRLKLAVTAGEMKYQAGAREEAAGQGRE